MPIASRPRIDSHHLHVVSEDLAVIPDQDASIAFYDVVVAIDKVFVPDVDVSLPFDCDSGGLAEEGFYGGGYGEEVGDLEFELWGVCGVWV